MAKTKKKAKPKAKKPARAATKRKAAPAKPKFGQVVHWEVQAKDPARAQKFFGELFGWKIDANNPMSYGLVSSGGKDGIDGGIGGAPGGASLVTFYVRVPDINATLAKAEALGAQTIMPRTDIGMVIMAQFRDLEGNTIGVIEG